MIPSHEDLVVVNAKVNQFPYLSDPLRFGALEKWEAIDAEGGDCEDFAIAKLRMLLGRGWPSSALRLATCWVETGEYHAVLLVDIGEETWVLDNRYPYPMEWKLLRYKWDKIQIAGSKKWESYS